MGRNKRKGSISKHIGHYLPPELWTDHILPRLPVKTLFIMRSVCKLWCSAIDDPAFVSMQLKFSKNNCDKNKLLAIEELGSYVDGQQRMTIRRRDTLRRCSTVFNSRDKYIFLIRCNELLFVQNIDSRDLRVLNPSIRKSLLLPRCPFSVGVHIDWYLFGYRPSSDDYVIYVFQATQPSPVKMSVAFAVYTLSDNIWRIRNHEITLLTWIYHTLHGAMFNKCKSVYLNGALHWLGNDYDFPLSLKSMKTHLVSFNFDMEEFTYLELPDSRQALQNQAYKLLFVLNESLAFLSISRVNSSIWVLENKTWNLRFSTCSSLTGFRYIRDHPHVFSKCFHAGDGAITLAYGNVAYNIMSGEIKVLTNSLSSYLILDTCLESLVLHRGCQGQILMSL